jgi:hypothetical protein
VASWRTVLGADLVVPGRAGLVLRGHHDVAGAGGEAAEALGGVEVGGLAGLRYEALLRRLPGDAHALADVGPGGARPPRLVHEVADQVVGQLAEVVRGDHGVGELVERVAVGLLDGLDEVVEADGMRHADWFRHVSTVG